MSQFQVFYDGDCPLCLREISMLRRLDVDQHIRFTNIAESSFDASRYGKSHADLMGQIHGRDADGEWVVGVEVFRRLYHAVGFRKSVAFSRLPVVSGMLNVGYKVFAKNRLRMTGRCTDDVCQTNPG